MKMVKTSNNAIRLQNPISYLLRLFHLKIPVFNVTDIVVNME